MKQITSLLISFSLMFLSCQSSRIDSARIEQINTLKADLASAQAEIASLQTSSLETPLVHLVLLNIKDDLSEENKTKLYEAITSLKNIKVVHELEIGDFADLKDQRALSDFEIGFQMNFKTTTDYATYQAHPIHLALKAIAKNCLAAPPTTYDFFKK